MQWIAALTGSLRVDPSKTPRPISNGTAKAYLNARKTNGSMNGAPSLEPMKPVDQSEMNATGASLCGCIDMGRRASVRDVMECMGGENLISKGADS
ncbi:hypothetical protein V6L77_09615 [Pannonibacter sp. Pt2-lr]|uniref:Uncharacterized protein n=1 Tax=Pannonibacter anstelovis TaxID=3121537 RepID=A0ABU7ZQL3_9HYPH